MLSPPPLSFASSPFLSSGFSPTSSSLGFPFYRFPSPLHLLCSPQTLNHPCFTLPSSFSISRPACLNSLNGKEGGDTTIPLSPLSLLLSFLPYLPHTLHPPTTRRSPAFSPVLFSDPIHAPPPPFLLVPFNHKHIVYV